MIVLFDSHYAFGIVVVLVLLVYVLVRAKSKPTDDSNNILNLIVFAVLAAAFVAVQIWQRLSKRRVPKVREVVVEQVNKV